MLGLIIVAFLGGMAVFYRRSLENTSIDLPNKLSDKLDKLWEVAQDSLREKKYLRAEKALLTILRSTMAHPMMSSGLSKPMN